MKCVLKSAFWVNITWTLKFYLKFIIGLTDNCNIYVCLVGSSCSSSRQNLTLSLSSVKDKGSQSCNYANGGLFSKYSGSAQSLASVSKETNLLLLL